MSSFGLSTFLIPVFILAGLILIQVFIWRIFKPQKQMKLLFLMFFALPLVFLGMTIVSFEWRWLLPSSVFLLSLCVVYIQSFPGFQAVSPSLEMVNAVKSYLPEGASRQQLIDSVQNDNLLSARLEDLERDGLTQRQANGEIKLNSSGLFLARVFFWYRRALGLPRGDG